MIWALFLTTLCAAQPVLYEEYPLLADSHGVVRFASRLTGDGTLFETVITLGASHDYGSFMEGLKNLSPRLFRNQVLLHQSQSLQHATIQNPRVILFDQGTILTFSEASAFEAREVEILGWDPGMGRFRSAELKFADRVRAKAVVRRDPPECAACHGMDLRPVWLPYDFWPGAYGASIGRTYAKGETRALKSLLDRAPSELKTSIYSHLDFRLGPQGVEIFTEFVAQLNANALLEKWKDGSADPFVPALIGILGNCVTQIAQWNEFLPSAWRTETPIISKILNEQRARRDRHKARLSARYEQSFSLAEGTDFSYEPERLGAEASSTAYRELFLSQAWGAEAMALGTSPFELPGSLSSPLNAEVLLATVLATDPERGNRSWYSELIQPSLGYPGRFIDWIKPDCRALKAESQTRLTRRVPFPLSPTPEPARVAAPLGRCAQCHAIEQERFDAPAIPFDEPLVLGEWLRDPARGLRRKIDERITDRGPQQMPPRHPLSLEEAVALRAALERIESLKR